MTTNYGERPGMERATVAVEFEEQRLSDMLCSALEGGSNYWYFIEAAEKRGATYLSDAPMAGGWLKFRTLDHDEIGGNKEWLLDRAAMVRGLEVMSRIAPKPFADFLSENDDANTGDVFLQCALFGDVVFG